MPVILSEAMPVILSEAMPVILSEAKNLTCGDETTLRIRFFASLSMTGAIVR